MEHWCLLSYEQTNRYYEKQGTAIPKSKLILNLLSLNSNRVPSKTGPVCPTYKVSLDGLKRQVCSSAFAKSDRNRAGLFHRNGPTNARRKPPN